MTGMKSYEDNGFVIAIEGSYVSSHAYCEINHLFL